MIDSGYDDTQWPLTNSRNGKSSGMLKLILHYAGAKTVSLFLKLVVSNRDVFRPSFCGSWLVKSVYR